MLLLLLLFHWLYTPNTYRTDVTTQSVTVATALSLTVYSEYISYRRHDTVCYCCYCSFTDCILRIHIVQTPRHSLLLLHIYRRHDTVLFHWLYTPNTYRTDVTTQSVTVATALSLTVYSEYISYRRHDTVCYCCYCSFTDSEYTPNTYRILRRHDTVCYCCYCSFTNCILRIHIVQTSRHSLLLLLLLFH